MPRDIKEGDKVVSGSVNLTGVITVKTESVYSESTVAKILDLVENSSSKKAKAENFITRFAKYYTPAVVIAAVVLAVLPPLIIGGGWSDWLQRALNFLVVSCPCALVISVPLSFFSGIGGASKRGVLIKGSNYLEVLSKVETVVFDKTGTLTKGCFTVSAIHPEKSDEAELLDVARDRFGMKEPTKTEDGYIIEAAVRVSRTFFAWITTFEGRVKILEPENVSGSYKQFIEKQYRSL